MKLVSLWLLLCGNLCIKLGILAENYVEDDVLATSSLTSVTPLAVKDMEKLALNIDSSKVKADTWETSTSPPTLIPFTSASQGTINDNAESLSLPGTLKSTSISRSTYSPTSTSTSTATSLATTSTSTSRYKSPNTSTSTLSSAQSSTSIFKSIFIPTSTTKSAQTSRALPTFGFTTATATSTPISISESATTGSTPTTNTPVSTVRFITTSTSISTPTLKPTPTPKLTERSIEISTLSSLSGPTLTTPTSPPSPTSITKSTQTSSVISTSGSTPTPSASSDSILVPKSRQTFKEMSTSGYTTTTSIPISTPLSTPTISTPTSTSISTTPSTSTSTPTSIPISTPVSTPTISTSTSSTISATPPTSTSTPTTTPISTPTFTPKSTPSTLPTPPTADKLVKTTPLLPAVERIFSRKKRFLLMPKKSNLKFTANLSKRLVAVTPRGFSFAIDAAFYYPMVSSVLDATPKRLRKPTTPAPPKPTGTTEQLLVHIPGTFLKYKAKPAIKPVNVLARIDDMGQAVQWIDKPHGATSTAYRKPTYTDPTNWAQWSKYETPAYKQKYAQWTPAHAAPQYQWHPPAAKWTKWTTPSPKWQRWQAPTKDYTHNYDNYAYDEWPRRGRWERALQRHSAPAEFVESAVDDYADLENIEPMYFPDLAAHEDWKHFHSHRDRRQLFHQFEGLSKILNIDMKSCILRAICDSKRFLLPPGYSMIQDMMRVIFTFPTRSGMSDDYSRAVQSDFVTCDKNLKSLKCPFSIFDWLKN